MPPAGALRRGRGSSGGHGRRPPRRLVREWRPGSTVWLQVGLGFGCGSPGSLHTASGGGICHEFRGGPGERGWFWSIRRRARGRRHCERLTRAPARAAGQRDERSRPAREEDVPGGTRSLSGSGAPEMPSRRHARSHCPEATGAARLTASSRSCFRVFIVGSTPRPKRSWSRTYSANRTS